MNFYGQLLQWLKNRLLLTDLLTRHPEIHDIELRAAGRHRRSAPHRHHASAQPAGGRADVPHAAVLGKRRAVSAAGRGRCRAGSAAGADGRRGRVHEHRDAALRAHARDDHRPRPRGNPAAGQRLLDDADGDPRRTCRGGATTTYAHDQTPHYEYLATQLKALQFLRGGRRWLLKSPQHLEQLPVLDRVFPGVIVVCHAPRPGAGGAVDDRDDHLLGAHAPLARCPCEQIAAYWVDRLELMLAALVRDRDVIGPERSIDVRFDDFMADELGVAEQVYALAGEPITDEARTRDKPITWRATSAADSARSRRHARCSDSTRTTCAVASRRTSSAFCPSSTASSVRRTARAAYRCSTVCSHRS